MRPHSELGQATVEFALTSLVFLTLITFVFDGGRILSNYITVSEAARTGARYASTHGSKSTSPVGPNNYTALRNEVQARAPGLIAGRVTITATWANASNAPGSSVTVYVSYAVKPVAGLFWAEKEMILRDHSTMVIQN